MNNQLVEDFRHFFNRVRDVIPIEHHNEINSLGAAILEHLKAPAPADVPMPEPAAYLYTLEYGGAVASTKVSAYQLNYPFGVPGSDYQARNGDGVSYVRQTPLYTEAALRGEVKP